MIYIFTITPIGKPRMTQSDKWKVNPNHRDPHKRQRPAVTRWFQYERDLQALTLQQHFVPSDEMRIKFFLPMPVSWSKTKREAHKMKPHRQKPDRDNLEKAFLDALLGEDCTVWHGETFKYWTDNEIGWIEVENI